MTALHVVVMGVAGCGKSEVGERIAVSLGLPLIEGDQFHPSANIDKMRNGVPLTDDDRAGWLDALAGELVARPDGAVLACSALKKAYRDRLRRVKPQLRFVHLALSKDEAQRRVANRPGHYMPASLVDSQFATLENPAGEPGVTVVDAARPLEEVASRAVDSLRD